MLSNGRFENLVRTLKVNWQGFLLVGLILTLLLLKWDTVTVNTAGLAEAGRMLLQIVVVIAMSILQFVVIFMYLGRPRFYWIDPGETGVTFSDYKGNDEVLEAARRIVVTLRGVKEFKQMGGETANGLLLVGPPGTGKSYLAQCIATEAGVPFGYLSASSVQNMFFGVSTIIVRNIYRTARKKARKYGACIIFIDEIDAIAQARTASMRSGGGGGMFGGMMAGGSLNELLLQMDPPRVDTGWANKILRKLGLRTRRSERPKVLTIGATNVVDTLDAALLRPGRFDRHVEVGLPDYQGRKDIAEYYLSKVKHENISLDRMSSDTMYYSPVSIQHIINEAVVVAHFSGRDTINYKDISDARETYEFGLRQPIRNMTLEERRRIAYHEAGHCVAAYVLSPRYRPVKATIIRRGDALGFVSYRDQEERHTTTREELLAQIQIFLAARACERQFLGTEMDGAVGDLQMATRMAIRYICHFGMQDSLYSNLAVGQFAPDGEQKRQVERLLDEQFQKVARLMQEKRRAVDAIAQALLEKEELDRDEIQSIMDDTLVELRSLPRAVAAD